MEEFDYFGETLFDEAKLFYEKACETHNHNQSQLFLHASLLLGISALEAYTNSVCLELVETEEYGLGLYEKMLLSERRIELKKGQAVIGNQLQMTRLIDRIEYIYCKYSHKKIDHTDLWNTGVTEAIRLRNELVHPKAVTVLSLKQLEKALNSILETVNVIFNAVYKQNVPIYNYGLQPVRDYGE